MVSSGPLAAFVARPPDTVTFEFWDILVGTGTSGTRASRAAWPGPGRVRTPARGVLWWSGPASIR